MRVAQRVWERQGGWQAQPVGKELGGGEARLVLVFGGTEVLDGNSVLDELQQRYPQAILFGCSTAGEIAGTRVYDDSMVATAISFDHTEVRAAYTDVEAAGGSWQAGEMLAREIATPGLRHLFVLSDGQQVNGSELVRGLLSQLPTEVRVTGGLAGDGPRFERTLVLAEGRPQQGVIAALGFFGDRLRIGYGSLGGWDPFGPERLITRSNGNVLYELDGKPALDLYRTYLGEHAAGLPATGLLFPLSIQRREGGKNLTRTILGVDDESKSLTFAGDMPTGSRAQLMKANFERLIDGASDAARHSYEALGSLSPQLAILISCVGRKLVLRQRTEEEVEGVRDVLGQDAALAGFYSYGEICPLVSDTGCELHNQTMTITALRED